MTMILLGEQEIQEAVSAEEMLDQIEGVIRFYETKDFIMPDRMQLGYGDDTLLLMPCFTKEAVGTKLITVFPGNAAKNLPVVDAVMIINDAQTGAPLALLNGRVLTALRTGAVGGVGVRHLSPQEPHALGLVGTGVQGFQQARFASTAGEITRINVFDIQSKKLPSFVSALSEALPGIDIRQAASIEDLLASSQTIITATTSKQPVLPDREDLIRGKHFIGIGSYTPDMREFPEALFRLLDRLFIDTDHAIDESGDLVVPLQNGWIRRNQVQTLGGFLEEGGDKAGIREQTTLFKSVGMALFDLGASQLIYQKAIEKNLGRQVSI